MIRKYIIIADDSIKGFDEEIAKLEREWGAEEIEPCDDCISRDEAIRVAEQGQIQGYEWQFKKLCNLQSVTPQRKTGKWIILDECANEGVYCSECHKKVFKLEFSPTMKWQNFEYCPNCGAKMVEPQESESDD
jgi:hypothetical protein